ncbi:ABC transporter permease [Streptomyces mirabilis]|uniref:ABC transporter permease n=1 Tax=Streptomyces mirabilis TaxID=68239 RepID=UPI0021C1562C|nr:ABC transporter permease [Streptomyces mirabilis]MCT9105906.1 ABC transporter permease [Streptomyces mirabilis]
MSGHPAGREAAVAILVLPLVITLVVLSFAWPAGRTAPRDVPVGIVGTGAASQHAVEGLVQEKPGAFDFHLYPDQQAARSAIENRDVYGALAISSYDITVLKASAASASVAQLLNEVGQRLADRAAQQGAAGTRPSAKIHVTALDVVPVAAEDPRGVVFSSAVFPLTICGILIGAFVSTARGLRRPWHRLLTLLVACAVAGLGAYLVAQGFLGALPHDHVATWAVLSLVLISISATAAGLVRLLGQAGLGLSAALMVFVGNPFSGAGSAPEMLPKGVDYVGQWLPPGAGASLLRDTAYFDGNGGSGHLAVLALWSVCGFTAVMFGRLITGRAPGAKTGTKTGATASGASLSSLPTSGAASPDRRHAHAHAHAHARRNDDDG